jgi:hypothetical protein
MSRIARAAALAVFLPALITTVSAEPQPPPRQRIRPTSAELATALDRGYDASATFRRLVDTLEQSPVLVYVETGRCPAIRRQRLNACLARLATAGGARYLHLRVVVDATLPANHLIATIGHELQHAVEAAESASGAAIDRRGVTPRLVGGNVYETDAAQDVKALVLRELQLGPPDCGVPPTPGARPSDDCPQPSRRGPHHD